MNGDVTVHLPHSLTDAAERIAREGGTTLDAFVASAVAEKLSAIQSAALLAERGRRADLEAFDRFMSRPNGFPQLSMIVWTTDEPPWDGHPR